MKSLFLNALLSVSILSFSNALSIPNDSVQHTNNLQARADLLQGRCYNGQVMDPDLEQTSDDLYPVCITKKILPCPAGKFPTHATVKVKSVCLPDPDAKAAASEKRTPAKDGKKKDGKKKGGKKKDETKKASEKTGKKAGEKFRKPSDPKLFYYRTAKGSKMQLDERTTPAARKEMKKKAFDTSKDLQEEQQDKENKKQEKVRKADAQREKQRIRRSTCLAVGSMSWLAKEDTNKLSDEEIEGLIEPDEDDLLVPETDIEEWMVRFDWKMVQRIKGDDTSTAGFFGWIGAAIKAGTAVSKSGRVTGSVGKALSKSGGKSSGERYTMLRNKKTKDKAASKKSIQAAKSSSTVKKILKDKTFQDCLKLAAKTVGKETLEDAKNAKRAGPPMKIERFDTEEYSISIDMKAKRTYDYPSPEDLSSNAIVMIGDKKSDARGKDEPDMTLQTFPDNYVRPDRIPYEHCYNFKGMNDNLKLLQTYGGTCSYYGSKDCKKFLFSMTNREDGNLKGKDDKAVSSAWCTFDLNDKRAPSGK
ncbi:unnamed protein product [Periconia digitata]|uniref:Uncharacterized protein n=1 Tax=Periconia digitata TaxID=1303443 RepID=A0A9W4UQ57_9PLEO|nr:unnamed protein product [Periconia digitata]